jgi:hypothetical protein
VSRSFATQHATSYEVVAPHPSQRSREMTPNSGEGAPSGVATHSGREGTKGIKKRCKQRLQGAMTTTDNDDSNDGEASDSGMMCISTTARSDKREARLPTDHFKRLLEEACPNHPNPVRH